MMGLWGVEQEGSRHQEGKLTNPCDGNALYLRCAKSISWLCNTVTSDVTAEENWVKDT